MKNYTIFDGYKPIYSGSFPNWFKVGNVLTNSSGYIWQICSEPDFEGIYHIHVFLNPVTGEHDYKYRVSIINAYDDMCELVDTSAHPYFINKQFNKNLKDILK